MEFRCRLASASGEIVEGVYVAESEARLRHELEEKGLYVLSLQPKGAVAGLSLRLPARTSIPSREFLIFNQELATLLRAGMPLVQSLDLLKRRIRIAGVSERVERRPRARPQRQRALGRVCGARDTVSERLHRVARGRRAQRQPRRGASALRRLHENRRDGEAQDDLGAGVSGDSDLAGAGSRVDHRVESRAGVLGLLRSRSARSCRSSRASSSGYRISFANEASADRDRPGQRDCGRQCLGAAAGPEGAA